jgi:hypothetical protein
VAVGATIIPTFSWTSGRSGVDWRLVPFFLLALLTLRVVPVVVRRILPFSDEARDAWSRQRLLAKRFDSYQWRKLLWIGLGLGVSAAWAGQTGPVPSVLAVACMLAGGLGAMMWRRVTRSNSNAAALSRTGTPAVARSAS